MDFGIRLESSIIVSSTSFRPSGFESYLLVVYETVTAQHLLFQMATKADKSVMECWILVTAL